MRSKTKKLLLPLFALVLALSMLCVGMGAVSAEADYRTEFSFTGSAEGWHMSQGARYSLGQKELCMESANDDPNLYYHYGKVHTMTDTPWMVVKAKLDMAEPLADGLRTVVYWTTAVDQAFGATVKTFPMDQSKVNSGKYELFAFQMNWGYVASVRLDLIDNGVSVGDTVLLDFVKICTEAEKDAILEAGDYADDPQERGENYVSQKIFDFSNGTSGWESGYAGMLGQSVDSKEGVRLSVIGSDPQLVYTWNDMPDVEEFDYFMIRMKNETTINQMALFWMNDGDTAYSANKCKVFAGSEFSSQDSEFKTYVYPLAYYRSVGTFTGKVKSMRLDIIEAGESGFPYSESNPGYVTIDYIAFGGTVDNPAAPNPAVAPTGVYQNDPVYVLCDGEDVPAVGNVSAQQGTRQIALQRGLQSLNSSDYVWTVDNESAAAVENGTVTFKATGKVEQVTVTATAKDNSTDIYTLGFTTLPDVTALRLNHTEYAGEEGDSFELLVRTEPEDVFDASVTFESSDSHIAAVDEEGKVSLVAPGTATITVVSAADAQVRAECTVTVTAKSVKVTSITLDQTSVTAKTGDADFTLQATVNPEDATDKSVTWHSSDESVATVENGIVSIKGEGTAVITVTANDGSGATASCELTVQPNQPEPAPGGCACGMITPTHFGGGMLLLALMIALAFLPPRVRSR